MSSLSLAKGPDVFKAAAALAPVTHWKFYDTIYTERFMQTPQQNPEGYEAYAPIRLAKNIPPHSYLLIHGTADDNVHYQNAMAMSEALIQNNIPFQMVSYPNRNHGLSGPLGSGRRHSYITVRDFFFGQFNLPIPTDR
jgi:dipeptidyl-peptidase-4